ncbi:MAG: RNA polymerase sigma factor [SAR324 cluster bacterium]|nr:RNA polymerase sigma factor [SAR324 cluster bacterium]
MHVSKEEFNHPINRISMSKRVPSQSGKKVNSENNWSDELLAVSAILGDLDAFEELVIRYRSAVVRLAQSIVGIADAEDIAQDALLLAFQALPSIENPERFAAWLMTITRNRALRFIKEQRLRRIDNSVVNELLLERLVSLNHPLLEVQKMEEDLKQALQMLPSEYALVIKMRFFDEVPLKRIGAFLEIPVSTVKWRIFRGKQLLRNQIYRKE